MRAASVAFAAALVAGCASAGPDVVAPGGDENRPWLMECAYRGSLPQRCTSRVPSTRRYDGLLAPAPPRSDAASEPDDDVSRAAAAPSELSALATRDFEQGRWTHAIPRLERVARGDSADDLTTRQASEYRLAVALKNAGDTAAAGDLFAAIAAVEEHPKHHDAIAWSLQLLRIGCVTPALLRTAAVSPHRELEYFDNPQHREQMAFADYAQARAFYEDHRDREARVRFAALTTHPRFGPPAKRCIRILDGASTQPP